ncbi:hypothetical protein ACH3VR_19605 [Microbacterium sp. B2969]|uniref:Uncharacterized protein n=1 Tax=Microbacterium alkaliflavum TaxID=3248839 RepID=A0ABW7QEP0_9MICO
MNTKSFGALAACIAGLAVVLAALSAALDLPAPIRIAMIAAAVLLLACAGGLIGAAVAAQRKSTS